MFTLAGDMERDDFRAKVNEALIKRVEELKLRMAESIRIEGKGSGRYLSDHSRFTELHTIWDIVNKL